MHIHTYVFTHIMYIRMYIHLHIEMEHVDNQIVHTYGTFHNKVNDIARSTGGQRDDSRRSGTRRPFNGQRSIVDVIIT